jgi:uncharacterized protein YndB with AHSA1/START domain
MDAYRAVKPTRQSTREPADHLGTLEPAGQRWRLRFTRRLAHSPDKVWRAITEPEHLAAWFPQRIVGEWKVGAPLRFESEFGNFDGEVLAFEPQSAVEFRWGTDTIRLELAPDERGTVLTLLDTFDEQGKAARDAAGWHVCLDALERELAGTPGTSAPGEDWQSVHAEYVKRLGPEAATIGPPEEVEQKTQARTQTN